MSRNNANSDKTEGFPLEPVTVSTELDGEQITIDAAHHVINDEAELLRLYIEGRDGGGDVSIPFGRDDTAWAHSDVGRRALGLDTHSDDADVEGDLTLRFDLPVPRGAGGVLDSPNCRGRRSDGDEQPSVG